MSKILLFEPYFSSDYLFGIEIISFCTVVLLSTLFLSILSFCQVARSNPSETALLHFHITFVNSPATSFKFHSRYSHLRQASATRLTLIEHPKNTATTQRRLRLSGIMEAQYGSYQLAIQDQLEKAYRNFHTIDQMYLTSPG